MEVNNMGWFSGKKQDAQWIMAPEYAEATNARTSLSNLLQQFAGSPDYGAVNPDWADIESRAQKKIEQTYMGGGLGKPGVLQMLQSSASKRGVTDSPALGVLQGRMASEMAPQLASVTTDIGTQKATMAENARQSLMSQLFGLAGMKPDAMYQPESKTAGFGKTLGTIAGAALGNMLMPGVGGAVGAKMGGSMFDSGTTTNPVTTGSGMLNSGDVGGFGSFGSNLDQFGLS
jgi:hypothetical protein